MTGNDNHSKAFERIADYTVETIKKIRQTYELDIAELTAVDISAIAFVAEGGRRRKWSSQYIADNVAKALKLKRKGHVNSQFNSDGEFIRWCEANGKTPTKRQYSKYKRNPETS